MNIKELLKKRNQLIGSYRFYLFNDRFVPSEKEDMKKIELEIEVIESQIFTILEKEYL
jgi:hypothetical protein